MTEKAFLPEVGRFNGHSLPTRWKGIIFRSRLEARWAIFFDSLKPKLPYEYEPELIETPYGPYLPDFYLPTIKTFWLVKGQPMDEREMKIHHWLAERFSIFVAAGQIPQSFGEMCIENEYPYAGSTYYQTKTGETEVWADYPMLFCQSHTSQNYGVQWMGCWTRIDNINDGDRNSDQPTANVLNALDIARNYRFDRRD